MLKGDYVEVSVLMAGGEREWRKGWEFFSTNGTSTIVKRTVGDLAGTYHTFACEEVRDEQYTVYRTYGHVSVIELNYFKLLVAQQPHLRDTYAATPNPARGPKKSYILQVAYAETDAIMKKVHEEADQ